MIKLGTGHPTFNSMTGIHLKVCVNIFTTRVHDHPGRSTGNLKITTHFGSGIEPTLNWRWTAEAWMRNLSGCQIPATKTQRQKKTDKQIDLQIPTASTTTNKYQQLPQPRSTHLNHYQPKRETSGGSSWRAGTLECDRWFVLGCPFGRKWMDQWWTDQWVTTPKEYPMKISRL